MSYTTGYYYATPVINHDCLDALPYEVVYLYFDAKWSIYRMGLAGSESVERWKLLGKVTPWIKANEIIKKAEGG